MRRICVVGSCATRSCINGCIRCAARRLLASAPPGEPNLSTSPLIGFLSNVGSEESPLESYLPGPCQRLVAGLRYRVAKRRRRDHAAAVGDEPPAGLEPGSRMEDEHPGRHLGKAADLESGFYRRVVRIVPGCDHDSDASLRAPAKVWKVRQRTFSGGQRHGHEI